MSVSTTGNNWTNVPWREMQVDWRDVDLSGLDADHGTDWELIENKKSICVQPSERQLRFLKLFAIMFLIVFVVAVWAFVPFRERWILIVGGLWCGGFSFAIIWYLLKQSADRGPAIELDLLARTVILPRLQRKFPFDSVLGLQWIRGTTQKIGWDCWTDLNLLVAGLDGQAERYRILGSPDRRHVRRIAHVLQAPVAEINLGMRGRRDVDVTNAGEPDPASTAAD